MGFHNKHLISFANLIDFYRQKSTINDKDFNDEKSQCGGQSIKMTDVEKHEITNDEPFKKWQLLKKAITKDNVDITTLFPVSCFGEKAYVLPGQLRTCFNKLSIEVSTSEIAQMLRRICRSSYAVRSEVFFAMFGLNAEGKSCDQNTSPLDIKKKIQAVVPNKVRVVCSAPENVLRASTTSSGSSDLSPGEPLRRSMTSYKVGGCQTVVEEQFEQFNGDLAQFINRKLNEGQTSVVETFGCKDVDKSGVVTKTQLRNVLRNLGFKVKAIQLEHFLSRAGIRRKDGLVNYHHLLRRLQTRTRLGILSKVMQNSNHVFHSGDLLKDTNEDVSAAFLECKLLRMFHKDYFLLLAALKESDSNHSGLIHIDRLRSVLEDNFSIKIGEDSWRTLMSSNYIRLMNPKKNNPDEEKTHVSYIEFISKFDVTHNTSDLDDSDPWIEEMDTSYLKEHKFRYLKMMGADPANHTLRHTPQPLHVLEAQLTEVLLKKFDNFKKEYDLVLREDNFRVDKEKFDYVMFRCGFILTPSELHRLWNSMPITRPMESLSFKTIMQHVVRLFYTASKPEKFNKETEHAVIVEYLLEKIKKSVTLNWARLKRNFRSFDPCGTSRVFKQDFLKILQELRLNVTQLEVHYLVEMLESRIPEKSDYMKMLGYYVKHKSTEPSIHHKNKLLGHSKRMIPKINGLDSMKAMKVSNSKLRPRSLKVNPVTMSMGYKEMKTRNKISCSFDTGRLQPTAGDVNNKKAWIAPQQQVAVEAHQNINMANSLMRRKIKPFVNGTKVGSLTRMLRKQDHKNTGSVPVKSFLSALASHGVTLGDPNDMFKFLSSYDQNLKQEIPYGKFLKALA